MPRIKVRPRRCPEGFYIFSKPVRNEWMLNKWKSHFEAQGKRIVVMQDIKKFYLCVEGKEAIGSKELTKSIRKSGRKKC